jgi:hypothetical protein
LTRIQAVMSGQRVTMSEAEPVRRLTLVPPIGRDGVTGARMQAPPDDGAKPPQQELDNLQDPGDDPNAKPPQQELDETTPPPPPDEG